MEGNRKHPLGECKRMRLYLRSKLGRSDVCLCVCLAVWLVRGEWALGGGGRRGWGTGRGGGRREGCPPAYGGARQLRPYLDQYGSTSQVRQREHKDCADVTPGTDDRVSTQQQLPSAASHNQARTHSVHYKSQELFQKGGIWRPGVNLMSRRLSEIRQIGWYRC